MFNFADSRVDPLVVEGVLKSTLPMFDWDLFFAVSRTYFEVYQEILRLTPICPIELKVTNKKLLNNEKFWEILTYLSNLHSSADSSFVTSGAASTSATSETSDENINTSLHTTRHDSFLGLVHFRHAPQLTSIESILMDFGRHFDSTLSPESFYFNFKAYCIDIEDQIYSSFAGVDQGFFAQLLSQYLISWLNLDALLITPVQRAIIYLLNLKTRYFGDFAFDLAGLSFLAVFSVIKEPMTEIPNRLVALGNFFEAWDGLYNLADADSGLGKENLFDVFVDFFCVNLNATAPDLVDAHYEVFNIFINDAAIPTLRSFVNSTARAYALDAQAIVAFLNIIRPTILSTNLPRQEENLKEAISLLIELSNYLEATHPEIESTAKNKVYRLLVTPKLLSENSEDVENRLRNFVAFFRKVFNVVRLPRELVSESEKVFLLENISDIYPRPIFSLAIASSHIFPLGIFSDLHVKLCRKLILAGEIGQTKIKDFLTVDGQLNHDRAFYSVNFNNLLRDLSNAIKPYFKKIGALQHSFFTDSPIFYAAYVETLVLMANAFQKSPYLQSLKAPLNLIAEIDAKFNHASSLSPQDIVYEKFLSICRIIKALLPAIFDASLWPTSSRKYKEILLELLDMSATINNCLAYSQFSYIDFFLKLGLVFTGQDLSAFKSDIETEHAKRFLRQYDTTLKGVIEAPTLRMTAKEEQLSHGQRYAVLSYIAFLRGQAIGKKNYLAKALDHQVAITIESNAVTFKLSLISLTTLDPKFGTLPNARTFHMLSSLSYLDVNSPSPLTSNLVNLANFMGEEHIITPFLCDLDLVTNISYSTLVRCKTTPIPLQYFNSAPFNQPLSDLELQPSLWPNIFTALRIQAASQTKKTKQELHTEAQREFNEGHRSFLLTAKNPSDIDRFWQTLDEKNLTEYFGHFPITRYVQSIFVERSHFDHFIYRQLRGLTCQSQFAKQCYDYMFNQHRLNEAAQDIFFEAQAITCAKTKIYPDNNFLGVQIQLETYEPLSTEEHINFSRESFTMTGVYPENFSAFMGLMDTYRADLINTLFPSGILDTNFGFLSALCATGGTAGLVLHIAEIIGYYCFHRAPDIETTAGWDALDYTSAGLILPIVLALALQKLQKHRLSALAVESAIAEQQPRIERTACKVMTDRLSTPLSISVISGMTFFLLLANYLQKVVFRREITDPTAIDLIEQVGAAAFLVLGPALLLNSLLYLTVAYKENQLRFTVGCEEEPEPSTSIALLVRSEHSFNNTTREPLGRMQQPSSFGPVHAAGDYIRSIPVGDLSLLNRIRLYKMCEPKAVHNRIHREPERLEGTAVTWNILATTNAADTIAESSLGLSIN